MTDEADFYHSCYMQSVQQFCAIARALGLPEDGTVTPETIFAEVERLKQRAKDAYSDGVYDSADAVGISVTDCAALQYLVKD